MRTALTELLGIDLPIVQAPMAGVSTPAMAAAASNAGALGSISVGAMNAAAAGEAIAALKSATNRPVNVNVFTHRKPKREEDRESAWLKALEPHFAALGMETPADLPEIYTSFNDDPEMQRLLIEARPAVVSFHFGLPEPGAAAALKQAGCLLFCTATTPAEAVAAEKAGMDVIVAQGYEAGGHRGVFDPDAGDAQIGLFALIPLINTAVSLPVVAAGGIANGAGIAAALTLGADGAQMGTVFVGCPESAAPDLHWRTLKGPLGAATEVTRAVSGRPARGVVNRLMADLRERQTAAPEYPLPYAAAKALAAAARPTGAPDYETFFGGQAAPLTRSAPAAELIADLAAECQEILANAPQYLAPDTQQA
ncbi:MAG: nitronate monooxygenase [Alphaproteobacteria bacterium]|nr:nitronate monooxygenase [Alphaproteobacteria bacterium]